MAKITSISRVQKIHRDNLPTFHDGLVGLTGAAAALLWALDDKFRSAALLNGAEEGRFPGLIAEDVLDRSEYFRAFPGCAIRVASPHGGRNYFLSPGGGYHCYDMLKDRTLSNNIILTCCGNCFRNDAYDETHLWDFTTRDLVFVGTAEFVRRQSQQWMNKVTNFASSLDLDVSVAQANGPFFGQETRGRKLLQQVKQLKFELNVQSPGPMPIASFNMHEQFFSERFHISLAGAGSAFTGCVAIGLERWCLALSARHGAPAALELVEEHDDLR